jgi:hypothetical protein
MGSYNDGPGDMNYGNLCAQRGSTTCKLISTACEYASEVCACTRRWAKKDPGLWGYISAGTCYGFTKLMACCGCGKSDGCRINMKCPPNGLNRPGGIYDCLPTVGPNEECPPGYRKPSGTGWVVG